MAWPAYMFLAACLHVAHDPALAQLFRNLEPASRRIRSEGGPALGRFQIPCGMQALVCGLH